MSSFMKQLREKEGLTQEDLSKVIGVSRPTYVAIESGAQILNVAQAQKLAKFYGMNVEDIIEERVSPKPTVVLEKNEKAEPKKTAPEIRISVPQNKVEKFKEVLLYILEEIGARPNVGKAVLCKLLYFIDFDYYEKYEEQLMGATYIKNHFGPTPPAFPEIVKEMEEQGELMSVKAKLYKYEQQKFLPLRKANFKHFSAREKELIDKNIERFKDFNAKQMEAYSHKDVPWITAEDQHPIDYESVFYRTLELSQRHYDDEV
ncbi:MAG: type II toxin-antitoxin system antitoxin SocA domain-containing protein [Candidatus Neomarinimicrobiota bacterium]